VPYCVLIQITSRIYAGRLGLCATVAAPYAAATCTAPRRCPTSLRPYFSSGTSWPYLLGPGSEYLAQAYAHLDALLLCCFISAVLGHRHGGRPRHRFLSGNLVFAVSPRRSIMATYGPCHPGLPHVHHHVVFIGPVIGPSSQHCEFFLRGHICTDAQFLPAPPTRPPGWRWVSGSC